MPLPKYTTKWERTGYGAFQIYCIGVIAFLIVPILFVIPMSFSASSYFEFPPPGLSLKWYKNFLSDKNWIATFEHSFYVGITSTFCATLLGTLASIGLVRGRFRGKEIIMAFILSPMVVPLIITACGMYFFLSYLRLIGTFIGLVVAHTALGVPFVVVVVSASLQGFDRTLERAAISLGASPLRTFLKITAPIVAPGIFSGAVFAFITSFDEVVIALFLAGPKWRTLPVKMFEGIRFEVNPTITAVATLVLMLAILVLLTSIFLSRRSERLSGKGFS
jgi:putative spermidine/putrescine transport system permease protein